MKVNMYQHQIDEYLDRARAEHQLFIQLKRYKDAEHVRNRIDSYKRLRKYARKARFAPRGTAVEDTQMSIAEILAQFQ